MSDRISRDEALGFENASEGQLAELLVRASRIRDEFWGKSLTYSRNVFIPLTNMCRDTCGYCTFVKAPGTAEARYMTPGEVLKVARAGKVLGCKEALFSLGERPELRYSEAREALNGLGYGRTVDYLREMCQLVSESTGLIPHANPGTLTEEEILILKPVTGSMGMMLESVSRRLLRRGEAHFGCPDKAPEKRLDTLENTGRHGVPFTTGILIGIGETWEERVDSLLAIEQVDDRFGHIQEVIVQNYKAKPGIAMAAHPEPSHMDMMRTIAVARLLLNPSISIQAPPNLQSRYSDYIRAGLNDWGGVSPLTIDYINPERAWPLVIELERRSREHGFKLEERLAVYPRYLKESCLYRERWDTSVVSGKYFHTGKSALLPTIDPEVRRILEKVLSGGEVSVEEGVTLFAARGRELEALLCTADRIRHEKVGDRVSFVVVRNINFTNICYTGCRFCAFAKRKDDPEAEFLSFDEIARRTQEAWDRGATEVCVQGGLHPNIGGDHYRKVVLAIKKQVPEMHIHAFSPFEVQYGARLLGVSPREFLLDLKEAGLGTIPGTAAEILDREVRTRLTRNKLAAEAWVSIVEEAHRLGIRSTATIMYGHIDEPRHWAAHIALIRDIQKRTGGFTEFVPLGFVHYDAPIYLDGEARAGPTHQENLRMHAVSRLMLNGWIENVQVSWVKMGPNAAQKILQCGANDLGGTLMNESISRAAGAPYGQEITPAEMCRIIREAGRIPVQRNTLYEVVRDFEASDPASYDTLVERVSGNWSPAELDN